MLRRTVRFAVPLAALLAAACNSSTVTPPSAPSAAQQAAVGATARDEVEADLGGLLPGSAVTPAFAQAVPTGLAAFSTPCVVPSSTTDTDGDGVFDDATWTFTNPPCSFTNRRGGTVALTGQLRIQDPTPAGAGFGHVTTLTDLAFSYTAPQAANSYVVTRNGTRTVTGNAAGLALATNVTIVRSFPSGASATVAKQWNVAFTPTGGASLVQGQPLPSGTLAITGTWNWTRGSESASLAVTTPTPLTYDATCTQAQVFTAGELRATGTWNGVNGYLRVQWNGCGVEPSVTFIAL